MAGLSKEQLAGKAAYTDANKDIKDAREWKDLDEAERLQWIETANADQAAADRDQNGPGNPPLDAKNAAPPAPAGANVQESLDANAKAAEQRNEAVGVAVVDPLPQKSLTLRDLAIALYREEEGDDAPEFASLDHKVVEEYEQRARRRNTPPVPRGR